MTILNYSNFEWDWVRINFNKNITFKDISDDLNNYWFFNYIKTNPKLNFRFFERKHRNI